MAFSVVPTVVAGSKVVAASFGNKVAAAAAELESMVSGGETGPDAAGPTSGTTPLNIDTATLSAVGVAGRLHVWSNVGLTKTVGTDRFTLTLQIAGVTVNRAVERVTAGDTTIQLTASGSAAVAAAATPTIDVLLTRASGTGTASPLTTTDVSLHWIFIPAP